LTNFWVIYVRTGRNTFFFAVALIKHKCKCFHICVTNQLASGEATKTFLWLSCVLQYTVMCWLLEISSIPLLMLKIH